MSPLLVLSSSTTCCSSEKSSKKQWDGWFEEWDWGWMDGMGLDGWMDGWMDRGMGWMDGWMDGDWKGANTELCPLKQSKYDFDANSQMSVSRQTSGCICSSNHRLGNGEIYLLDFLNLSGSNITLWNAKSSPHDLRRHRGQLWVSPRALKKKPIFPTLLCRKGTDY